MELEKINIRPFYVQQEQPIAYHMNHVPEYFQLNINALDNL
jgi:hypothetical protein